MLPLHSEANVLSQLIINFYLRPCFGNNSALPFKEGRTIVENRTADIIQETRKLHIRKKGSGSEPKNQATNIYTRKQPAMQTQVEPQLQDDQEIQLKASRDVRWQMCITSSYNVYILHVWIAPFVRIF